MARRSTSEVTNKAVSTLTAAGVSAEVARVVSGNPALVGAAAIFKPQAKVDPNSDRQAIAKGWQVEAYRHVKICGEARYAAVLFSSTAGRAEIGVSEPQTLRDKPTWVTTGPEVEAFAEIAPTVRERTRLVRDYMMHRTIAGECYLIARARHATDPGYVEPPSDTTWEEYIKKQNEVIDVLDPDFDEADLVVNPNVDNPIWEIVAVTELRRNGAQWQVRLDNEVYVDLAPEDPVVRLWNPDPEHRREAWSPFQALLPTLREIEWLTLHIFTQVKSRLMSAGVWFLPENITFPKPPPSAVNGGAETIAAMNEAEQFMATLAASSVNMLEADEVSFPTIVMADAAALEAVDQAKLIKFWSEIDDKAMILRNAAIRRFGEGFDMPGDRLSSSAGVDSKGNSSGGSGTNHWGEWAKEEQTIADHIEPALDDFVGVLTAVLRNAVEGTPLVIAYGSASLRLRQDRSKESVELYDRGVLKAQTMLRENGFDPESDLMDEAEHKLWLLNKVVTGQFSPEQMAVVFQMLTGVELPVPESGSAPANEVAGRDLPPSLEDHPYEGPPQGDHEHNDAAYATSEVLVLRALEKYGNRLLNDGKRGKDRDRTTPPHEAHLTASARESLNRTVIWSEFDFSLAEQVDMGDLVEPMGRYCARLYNAGEAYSREALIEHLSKVGAA